MHILLIFNTGAIIIVRVFLLQKVDLAFKREEVWILKKQKKKNIFTPLGGCIVDPILHLSSIASKTENREIKELITPFSVFY